MSDTPSLTTTDRSDRMFAIFNAAVSSAALAFLTWLLILREAPAGGPDLSFMPGVNAVLNSVAAAVLGAGWWAVRRRKLRLHKFLMVTAFACSALFLVGYVAYHFAHGDTKFAGEGAIRTVYLAILASHVLLSMAIVPMALTMFWLAARKRFASHRKLGRALLPIWMYVSLTGVLVYGMLHRGWFT